MDCHFTNSSFFKKNGLFFCYARHTLTEHLIIMLAILPFISLICLSWIIWQFLSEWRQAILLAAVAMGIIVAVSSELLSIFKALDFSSIFLLWLLINLILVACIFYLKKKYFLAKTKVFKSPKLTPISWVLVGGIIFIVSIVGIIALVAPPNNWDSMTYHMSRVVHWIQNRSLVHYPTYYSAQLVHPPFAELAILHLQILSNSDKFANLVQWFSMLGSILGVSLIAKQLGAKEKGEIFAAVFSATLPMGILQSSSTQNDYMVAFWLVCLANSLLSILSYNPPKKVPFYLLWQLAASMSLAILTKSSSYFFTLPFMIWLLIIYFKRLKWQCWKPLSFILLFILLINLGHYLRNFALYNNPIAVAEYATHYKIEVYSLPTFISNIIRNLSLHVDIVRYLKLESFIEPITGKVDKIITIIHHFLGIDKNDSRITFPPNSYSVPGISFGEDTASNPLHLLIIFVGILVFIIVKKLRKDIILRDYLLAIIGGFLVLCFMTKLQPYHSRHHLALFVLFSPFLGAVFSRTWNRYIVAVTAIILIVTCLPWVFENKYRPIATQENIFNTSRDEQYFKPRPQLKEAYFEAADFLKKQNCTNIGLSLGWEAAPSEIYWEYPFWVLLKERLPALRIEHILHPENASSRLEQIEPFNNFNPCAIIAIRKSQKEKIEEMTVKNTTYTKQWSSNPLNILLKK